MMTKRSRILILVASLAMGLIYVLPVWTISLEAPQYPEGLGMVIMIDDIVGQKEHDLNNINNLNHYIGMKRIVPESIPELDWMPLIVGVLIGLGVLTAAVGRRPVLYGWITIFTAISVVGMVDFWKWEYDYGHDLDDETAIIKIPGMSYQPPLIGSRQILNFTAHSWPGAGGWIAILASMVGTGVAVTEFRRGWQERSDRKATGGVDASARPTTVGTGAALLLGATLLSASACSEPTPRQLAFGSDACGECHMGLADDRYGAQLVTQTGKRYVFDSAECLVTHLATVDASTIHSLWVIDFAAPRELVPVDDAYFLVSDALPSPMGAGLTAFGRVEDRDGAVHAFGGDALDWDEVVLRVRSTRNGAHPAHDGHVASVEERSPEVATVDPAAQTTLAGVSGEPQS